MGFYVPEALKNCAQWIVWRSEPDKAGKNAKIPYSPRWKNSKIGVQYKAKTDNRSSWGTFTEAAELLTYGDYSGLGFVLSAQDDFVFIDLDHAIDAETGEYSQLAEDVLELFAGTYSEISQSETGLHIICRGHIDRAIKTAEIEVYSSGRYVAFTGNAIEAAEPETMQEALNTLYGRYAPAEAALQISSAAPAEAARSTTEAETMARAERGRCAAEFAALFAGEWEGRFSSQSEADLRLMGLLYWYSYQNDEITISLFKKSGLADRSKAARREYLERTLQRVKNSATTSASRAAYQRTPGKSKPAQPEEKKQRTRKYWNK